MIALKKSLTLFPPPPTFSDNTASSPSQHTNKTTPFEEKNQHFPHSVRHGSLIKAMEP